MKYLLLIIFVLLLTGCGGAVVGGGIATPEGDSLNCTAPDSQCLQRCDLVVNGVVTGNIIQRVPDCNVAS